jgi:hypothetical protein
VKGNKLKTEHERFISKVIKTKTCWLWNGAKYRFGYGHFRRKINNKWIMYKAHRYAYEYYKEEIPANFLVCHTCDNSSCVNPEHLWIGTHKQNTRDMENKGRWKMIRNKNHNLLNLGIARNIRKYKQQYPTIKLKEIAQEWGTSIQQISRILRNEIWQEEL